MLILLGGLFFLMFLLAKWYLDGGRQGKKLPPGPWGFPVIGHLPLLGRSPEITLMRWKDIYGPIIYCRFGSYPTVVLGDAKLVKQAFCIPEFCELPEFQEMVEGTNKKGIAFSEGVQRIEQRRFAFKNLKSFGMGGNSIEDKIQENVLKFLEEMKEKEGQLIGNKCLLNSYILGSLWSIIMTEKLEPQDFWRLCKLVVEDIVQLGSTLCQLAFFMPWIENLTRKISLSKYSIIRGRVEGYHEIFEFMKANIEKRRLTWVNQQPRDITDAYLDKMAETKDVSSSFHNTHDMSAEFIGDLFIAGAVTTSATLEWALNYMARHLLVQKRLQDEIDHVIGPHRLPSLADRPNLPYADAIVYEVLRLSTVTPLVLRVATVTVDFQGFTIPKGTVVMGNFYGIHHDPTVWGDAESFRPERFLDEEGKRLKVEKLIAFGSGKRSCIGEVMAKDQIFLYLTAIFQRFNVQFPDPNNPPTVHGSTGMALLPTDFQILFKSRHFQ